MTGRGNAAFRALSLLRGSHILRNSAPFGLGLGLELGLGLAPYPEEFRTIALSLRLQ